MAKPGQQIVTEGISGMWHYHVSIEGPAFYRSLCGAQVMRTMIPIAHWGMQFGEHFPKRPTWCKTCAELKDKQ